ncbi:replication restart helicase PriA [Pseudofulvibacter geojedonensis]|uniref:replication restart helicase PriA n=1 Tax=Pseudofulvibacter geojedonensis TaxID=1123758 RepID=UPI003670F1D8
MRYFIDVILPIPLIKLFTYSINEEEAKFILPGMRVAVPFGKSKIYTAIVHSVHESKPETYEAKEIHQILDETPIVTQEQLTFWQWISSYYMCSLGDVMRASLPSAFILESETLISRSKKELSSDQEITLTDDEFVVLEALENQSALTITEVSKILNKKQVLKPIKALLGLGYIQLREEIYEQYKPKLVKYIKLKEGYDKEEALIELLEILSRAQKQKEAVMAFFSLKAGNEQPIKAKELEERANVSTAVLKALVEKEVFEFYYIQTDRNQFLNETENSKILNEHQEKALEEIRQVFAIEKPCLLHGVTASGKTEIYVKLIEEVLAKGKNTLYLLPEIALTTQLIARLKNYFADKIVVFHSKYSVNERVESWQKVLQNTNTGQVIIGARSSVLLPFANLGLVIVDEEHEQSFKQFDPAPRYHARDAALVLAKQFNAHIILGSATPSLESYYNTTKGKYGLVELKYRHNNVLMPAIELVDIKDKHKRKRMTGHFSDVMLKAIHEAIENKEQVILFQNRRGYSPIVECGTCGEATQCPNCDVSLTYHQYRNELRCHYCSYAIAMQHACLSCGSPELDTKGFGTEQIEKELTELFPDLKIGRMDLDTTRGKYGYQKIITAFEQHEIDILVGTQMLTKGLDFKNVSLVGVLNADSLLNFPDFRAHERSYQLLSQVAGRAGRFDKKGRVLIQTFNPFHQILQQVSSHDYLSMYKEQLEQRYIYKYPPTNRLLKITLRHRDYNKVNTGADWFATSLRNVFGNQVLGPEFPPVSRIRNEYHKHILLKMPINQSMSKSKKAILKIQNSFMSVKDFRPIRVVLNVDNY